MFIFINVIINKVNAINSSLTDQPVVARRIFLEAVGHRLGDLKIVQARLRHYQKRLLLSKIFEAGKRSNKDAKVLIKKNFFWINCKF